MEKLPALRQAATLKKEIMKVSKATTEMTETITELCQQSLIHFHDSGDATLATMLVKDTGKAVRKESIKAWFIAFAPLSWVAKVSKDASGNEVKEERFVKARGQDALAMWKTQEHDADGKVINVIENADGLALIYKALEKSPFDMFKELAKPVFFTENVGTRILAIVKDYNASLEGKGKYERTGVVTKPSKSLNEAMELLRKANAILSANEDEVKSSVISINEVKARKAQSEQAKVNTKAAM